MNKWIPRHFIWLLVGGALWVACLLFRISPSSPLFWLLCVSAIACNLCWLFFDRSWNRGYEDKVEEALDRIADLLGSDEFLSELEGDSHLAELGADELTRIADALERMPEAARSFSAAVELGGFNCDRS